MRFSLVVRASDCQCRSRNSPGFDPNNLRHSGIWMAADEAVLKTVQREEKEKSPCLKLNTTSTGSQVPVHILYGWTQWTIRGSDRLSGRTSLLSARAPWIKATLWNRDQGVGCRLCTIYHTRAHIHTEASRSAGPVPRHCVRSAQCRHTFSDVI